MSDVVLQVNGRHYIGWERLEVVRSLEAVTGVFEAEMSAQLPGLDGRNPIRPGDACSLKLDGETVITGYVDDVALRYDARRSGITVRGRDATGDLVDCSLEGQQFKNQTLTQIAAALAGPFGIAVSSNVQDAATPFASFAVETGETVFEALERAARQRGVLLNSDGAGGLELTQAQGIPVATTLQRGVNILAVDGTASWRERHDTILVKGQSANPLQAVAAVAAQQLGRAADTEITRHRPLVLAAEDQGDGPDYKTRAEWERGVRYARGVQVDVTVQGWRHAGGLWAPNTLIPLQDDWLGIDEPLLCTAVSYRLDESGTTALLSLTRPGAYKLLPKPAAEASLWAT
jgi:prophage tail gpP-like protein